MAEDGCDQTCALDDTNDPPVTWSCTIPLSDKTVCTAIANCGDGTVNTANGEKCDDGNNDDGDGCKGDCSAIENGWICLNETTTNADGEASVCVESCGDGAKYWDHWGETCDDNNTANGDGCSSTCQIELGYQCDGSISNATESGNSTCAVHCGDGDT